MVDKEKKIVEILLSDKAFYENKEPFKCKFSTSNQNIKLVKHCLPSISFEKKRNWVRIDSIDNELLINDIILKILIHFVSEGKIYSDVEFEINPDGSYSSRYWFDEERLYKEEYDSAMLVAKDFPHAEANSLVNHQLAYKQKFKRKFERIILTYWIEGGLPHFELYSINKKNQKLPIELDNEYIKNTNDILKKHYEVTNSGILKDVWKTWNKIILSIPPNGYLDENEDIEYYLDDVKLEKIFF